MAGEPKKASLGKSESRQRQAIVVAGMHRCGTSAVARMLMLLGADGPRHLMPPRKGNEAGHWEPVPIVDLDDELLSAASMDWDDVGALPLEWLDGPDGQALRRRAVDLISSEYGDSALFVLKDPRICRLVPFWNGVLEEMGIDASYVLPQRNPLEVAASLKRRDGIPTSRALLLWLRYVLESELDTRGQPRAFVSYEALLRDWDGVSRAISDRLGVKWRGASHKARLEIDRFISTEGRHHEIGAQELEARPDVVDWVKRTYSVMSRAAAANRGPEADALDDVRALLQEADMAYGPVLAESEGERSRLTQESVELGEQLRGKEALAEHAERLAGELRTRDEALARSSGELHRVAAELADREVDAARARQHLAESETERNRLSAEFERLSVELGSRRADSEQVHRQLAATEAERQRLAEEGAVLMERLRGREEALAQSRGEGEQLAAALGTARDEHQQLVRDLGEDVRRMSAELAALREGRIKRAARRLGGSRRSTSQLFSWVAVRPSRQRLRYVRTYLVLRRSGEFDPVFYQAAYPDVVDSLQNPLMHFVEHGVSEGRDPNSAFSVKGYLACHPELAKSGVNPLLHWLRSGRKPLSLPPGDAPGDSGNGASPSHRPARRRSVRASKEYREFVSGAIPSGGTAVIASDGESGLLELPDVETRGFPQGNGSGNGGSAPREGTGSVAALAQLEWQRAQGAEYLVLPQVTREWWGSLPEFHSYVGRHYPWTAVTDQGAIAALRVGLNGGRSWQTRLDALLQDYQARFRGQPSILDLTLGMELAASFPELTVIQPLDAGNALPYLDDSIDLVIAGEGASGKGLAEGRRVARNALIRIGQGPEGDWEGVEWLRDPDRRLPTVSILIPSYDGAGQLATCLQAVKDTVRMQLEVEVLVIDDGSTDSTGQLLSSWSERDERVRHVRNDTNLGFVDSCNMGAARAEGQVLVFLNNDTIPVNGWLQPLVETLSDCDDAGAVGGMLLYPDGTLQEAGGVIFSDGSGANFGKGDSPDYPLYRFVRAVDYCSGALLATERRAFEELGGFDSAYRPGYYEDADYCFRLRDAGLNAYYQPKSVVIHVEGGTAGTDLSEGPKRHQVLNRETFRARWEGSLSSQPSPPDGFDQATWSRLARCRRLAPTG